MIRSAKGCYGLVGFGVVLLSLSMVEAHVSTVSPVYETRAVFNDEAGDFDLMATVRTSERLDFPYLLDELTPGF